MWLHTILLVAFAHSIHNQRIPTVNIGDHAVPGDVAIVAFSKICLDLASSPMRLQQEREPHLQQLAEFLLLGREKGSVEKILDGIEDFEESALEHIQRATLQNDTKLFQYEYLTKVDLLLVKNNRNGLENEEMLDLLHSLPCMASSPALESVRTVPRDEIEMHRVSNNERHISLSAYAQSNKRFQLPRDPHVHEQWYLFGEHQGERFGTNTVDAWASIIEDATDTEPSLVEFRRLDGILPRFDVAIVDSGCMLNEDLIHKVAYSENCSPGQTSYIDPDTGLRTGCFGHHFADESTNPTRDIANHGTPATSIIAAQSDNNIGISGICPNCAAVCLNIVNSRSGRITSSSIIKAIDYIMARDIRVSNHSYGGYGYDEREEHAFRLLTSGNNHIAFAAAGNAGCNIGCNHPTLCPRICKTNQYWTPPSFKLDKLITIGSVDRDGRVSSFSNVGDSVVHFFAPGNEILSLSNTKQAKLAVVSGTSFSAPIVTAAASLLWSAVPYATAQHVKVALIYGVKNHSHLTGFSIAPGVMDVYRSYHILKVLAKRKS